MAFYKTEGIIYKIKDFQDYDKIIWILTKNHGKVSAMAKGIRRAKSRRSPHVDLMNFCNFSFHEGRNFDVMTEAVLINRFEDKKKEHAYHFFYLAELIDKLVMDEDEAKEIYSMIKYFLLNSDSNNFKKLLTQLEIKLLKIVGFEPELNKFKDTGEEFSAGRKFFIDIFTPSYNSKGEPGSEVPDYVVKCQKFLLNSSLNSAKNLNLKADQISWLSNINRKWLTNSLEIKLNSLKYLS